jgi:hypothetical protein
MSNQFAGAEQLMQAITGAPVIREGAYRRESARLMQERSRQAILDKRIEQALLAEDINANRADLRTEIDNPLVRALVLGGTGVGSNFKGAQQGVGVGQQNDARSIALDALKAGAEGGDINQDLINAGVGIAANKPLSVTQTRVVDQAVGEIAKDKATENLTGYKKAEIDAKVRAFDALVTQRQASANLSDRKTGTTGGKKNGRLTDWRILQLFPMPETGPNVAYQKFAEWNGQQKMIDPRYNDEEFAYSQYQRGVDAKSVVAGAKKEAAVSSVFDAFANQPSQQADTKVAGDPDEGTGAALPDTQAEAQEAAQVLVDAANDAIAQGANRDEVARILEAELAKMGITWTPE